MTEPSSEMGKNPFDVTPLLPQLQTVLSSNAWRINYGRVPLSPIISPDLYCPLETRPLAEFLTGLA